MSELKIVPKTTRMTAIVATLPKDDFGVAVLEKRIRQTHVGGRGITSRQSVQEYIGLMLNAGMIIRRGQHYRVTLEARTPGTIVVTTRSELQIPLVIDLIERALAGTEGVKIIEEVKA
jgi:hypothetical protein